jgi:DNA-binding response OmpR family regulator
MLPGDRALSDLVVVLVVEDDAPLQSIIEDALTDGRFEPAIAASGEEAVTLLMGLKGKYRALVTDVQLRGVMDGWEVAKRAREIDPEFPIVYMTGGHAAEWPSHGVPNSILLTKPFAPAQLVTAVSQLLNAGKPTT